MHFLSKLMDNLATNIRFDYLSSERESSWGLWVPGTGMRIVPPGSPYQVYEKNAPYQWGKTRKGRILNDFQFVYITEGKGLFWTHPKKPKKVQAGNILVVLPGKWHNYFPLPDTGWVEHWVSFNGKTAQSWLRKNMLSEKRLVLQPNVNEHLLVLFEELLNVAQTAPPYANQIQSGLAMQIVAHTFSLIQSRQDTIGKNGLSIIEEAKCYLHDHWNKEVDMKEVAESLNVSYRHFRRLFKSSTGVSPKQYVLNLKINQSKKLMEGDFTIKSVAYKVGFADPYHFSRIFKQKTGASPMEWKNNTFNAKHT
jgi:AraC-like DNA-binding protein